MNPHALRHTFATRLVEGNVALSIVKDLLGHASISTTQRYTHSDREIERDAVGSVSALMSVDALTDAPRLNGARNRAKFADIPLPDFSVKERRT